jgi:hypothetical protein
MSAKYPKIMCSVRLDQEQLQLVDAVAELQGIDRHQLVLGLLKDHILYRCIRGVFLRSGNDALLEMSVSKQNLKRYRYGNSYGNSALFWNRNVCAVDDSENGKTHLITL